METSIFITKKYDISIDFWGIYYLKQGLNVRLRFSARGENDINPKKIHQNMQNIFAENIFESLSTSKFLGLRTSALK
jgi:hypothetical protein